METNQFYKGDRVEFNHPKTGALLLGIVKNVGLTRGRVSVDQDGGGSWKGNPQFFRPSKTPLPPAPPRQPNPFCVGDRVEWEYKGKTEYGTVKTVRNDRISVDMDSAYATFRGPFKMFRKSTVQRPKPGLTRTDPPMPIDAFSISGYREIPVKKDVWEGHEGNGYHAKLVYNGKVVGQIYNEGVGGCSQLDFVKGFDGNIFWGALKNAWTINGGKEEDYSADLLDTWTFWVAVEKPRGKWFWQHIEEDQAFCDKIRGDKS